MLHTKRKQSLLALAGLFIAFCAIGFSYNENSIVWFWQKYPFLPMIMLIVVFFIVKQWLKLEIENQRLQILVEYNKNISPNDQSSFNILLSKREIEVLGLINSGLSNKEISATLNISLSTVKTHINNIYKILEVKNRREALEKL